jgi:nitrile hydratase accessory protein
VDTSGEKKVGSGSPKPTERASESPVFNEPWEAEALALAISLQDAGQFTAVEWSEALGAEIGAAQARGDPDDGTTYYRHVLAALECLVREKGLASRGALLQRRRDWEAAYRATPHGRPVTLATPADGAKGRRGAGRSQRP